MVRLRSNRWYSAEGQGKSRASVATRVSGSRRVLSMCFLLALVILLMQRASDPRHVRNAFNALGVPLERDTGLPSPSAPADHPGATPPLAGPQPAPSADAAPIPSVNAEADRRWQSTCRDLVPRLLQGASSAQIAELSRRWFAVLELEPLGDSSSLNELRDQTTGQLAQLQAEFSPDRAPSPDGPARAADEAWSEQLESFSGQWSQLWREIESGQPQPSLSAELVANFEKFLDRRLLASLRDATPWTKSESTAFWRLLQQGQGRGGGVRGGGVLSTAALDEPPRINTLQLEAEFSIYRGQPVRYRGTVHRAELIERGSPEFGIQRYWSLWLRGEDEAAQPVTVYSTQAICQQFEAAIAAEQLPRIEVLAIVGKRLAYASPGGVEVAPTLFASSILQFADQPPAFDARATQHLAWDFGWAALTGALVAVLVLVPILANWRRRKTAAVRRTTGRTAGSVLLLVCTASAACSQAQSVDQSLQVVQGEQGQSLPPPPWARSDSDTETKAVNLLSARLRESLNAAGVQELQDYLADQSNRFPTAALQAVHALRQIGWEPALAPGVEIQLPSSHLVARSEEFTGWVRLAMPVPLDAQQQLWFQQDSAHPLYRLEVEPTSASGASSTSRELVTVFCTEVPSQWLVSPQLHQPMRLRGMSLSVASAPSDAPAPVLCILGKRPVWKLPAEPGARDPQPPWTPLQLQLDRLGWDLAHLDIVSRRNQEPIGADEAEAFFSLLRGASSPGASLTAASRLEAVEPPSQSGGHLRSTDPKSLLQVLEKPRELVGAAVDWPVRVVSGAVVEVHDPQHRRWLEAERYFQFDGFVHLGNQSVQYKLHGPGGDQAVKFEGEFPVTIVTRDRPAFVPLAKLQAGELSWSVGEYVRLSGIFYRLWSYESELMNSQSSAARQAAPLVMATGMLPTRAPLQRASGTVGWFGYALTLAILGILAGVLWSVVRNHRVRQPRARAP